MEYFKEIRDENINKPFIVGYIDTIDEKIETEYYNFYQKYYHVFTRIDRLNKHFELLGIQYRLKEIHRIEGKVLITKKDYELIDNLYSEINGLILSLTFSSGSCKKETEKSLRNLFSDEYEKSKFLDTLSLFYNKMKWKYYEIYDILDFYCELLKLVNITNDNLLEDIKSAMNELLSLRKVERKRQYGTYSLPNSWYILPSSNGIDAMPYNTTGQNVQKLWFKAMNYNHCSIGTAKYYFYKARELQNRDFVRYDTYRQYIRYCISVYHPICVFDTKGEPYGVRKELLKSQQETIRNILFNLVQMVPEDKKYDFERYIMEREKTFNVLDSRGLAISYSEILNKAYDYAKETFSNNYPSEELMKYLAKSNPKFANMTPESFYATQIHIQMLNIENALQEASAINIDDYDKSRFFMYNPTAKNLVIGYYMAAGILTEYFAHLYENVKDYANYKKCIDYLRQIDIEEFFVRCLGFHKVLRQQKGSDYYKAILTSDPNYEEVFNEYIERGWKIEFYPPIKFDESGNLIEEDQHKIKEFHSEY